MNWGSIVTGLLGFASGGWGSAVSIVLLCVGAFFIYRMWKKSVQDQAHNNSLDQAAVDQAHDIHQNQTQGAQAAADQHAADVAHDAAISALAGRKPGDSVPPT